MEINEDILTKRTELLNEKVGIRVGDFIKLFNDTYLRVSYDWGDSIQTAKEKGDSSFYLSDVGCSFSGSLYPCIDKAKLQQIEETKKGKVWFFKEDYAMAHNGITFEISFRVFELTDKDFEKDYINTWFTDRV